MVEWHMKSRKKYTGGIRNTDRRSTKKLAWRGGNFSETKLSEKEERITSSKRGNTEKSKLKYSFNVNVTDPESNKVLKAKGITVIQNDANRQFARRNIVTKGAVIEIEVNNEKKHAKITSRPGQHGVINAIVIKEIEDKKKTKQKKKAEKTKKTKQDKKETDEETGKKSKEELKDKKTEEKEEAPKKEEARESKEKQEKTVQVKEEKNK